MSPNVRHEYENSSRGKGKNADRSSVPRPVGVIDYMWHQTNQLSSCLLMRSLPLSHSHACVCLDETSFRRQWKRMEQARTIVSLTSYYCCAKQGFDDIVYVLTVEQDDHLPQSDLLHSVRAWCKRMNLTSKSLSMSDGNSSASCVGETCCLRRRRRRRRRRREETVNRSCLTITLCAWLVIDDGQETSEVLLIVSIRQKLVWRKCDTDERRDQRWSLLYL